LPPHTNVTAATQKICFVQIAISSKGKPTYNGLRVCKSEDGIKALPKVKNIKVIQNLVTPGWSLPPHAYYHCKQNSLISSRMFTRVVAIGTGNARNGVLSCKKEYVESLHSKYQRLRQSTHFSETEGAKLSDCLETTRESQRLSDCLANFSD